MGCEMGNLFFSTSLITYSKGETTQFPETFFYLNIFPSKTSEKYPDYVVNKDVSEPCMTHKRLQHL